MYLFIQAGEHILLHEFPDDARYIVLPSTQHNITFDTMSTGGKVKVNIQWQIKFNVLIMLFRVF